MSKYAVLDAEQDKELRMVLVGKTGVGKSAAGNTIVGRKAFKSTACSTSVTVECHKETTEFEGQILAVVDTPGLFDTSISQEVVTKEIMKCISLSAPGPHVFLVVIKADRFTKEEQETVKIIQKIFGEESARYTMVLFTRGDDLEADGVSVEEFIKKDKNLNKFISECGGRFHVFNNRDKNPSQVRELLKKINSMVQRNGGKHFINDMLEKAEKAIEEKKEELLKENPNVKPEEARRQAEIDNGFISNGTVVTIATVTGAATAGAALGSVVGPAGALIGAGVGAAVGGIAMAVKDDCVIQ